MASKTGHRAKARSSRLDSHRRRWPCQKYSALDVVECGGASFIAVHDNPGACPPVGPEDGWQLLSRAGSRGDTGPVGPRGRKGERGCPGEDAPQIVSSAADPPHYRLHMTLSNGKAGPVIDLRPLFEQFNNEAVIPAVDEAMDAAKKPKLLGGG